MKRTAMVWTVVFVVMLFFGLRSTFNQYQSVDNVVHAQFHKR
jgi:hypothetical protein